MDDVSLMVIQEPPLLISTPMDEYYVGETIPWTANAAVANGTLAVTRLSGPWECAQGDGGEGAELAAGQAKLSWQPVKLPGPFMKWSQEAANQTKIVWARRTFSVTSSQADGLAVLRCNRIANDVRLSSDARPRRCLQPFGIHFGGRWKWPATIPGTVMSIILNEALQKIGGASILASHEPSRGFSITGR